MIMHHVVGWGGSHTSWYTWCWMRRLSNLLLVHDDGEWAAGEPKVRGCVKCRKRCEPKGDVEPKCRERGWNGEPKCRSEMSTRSVERDNEWANGEPIMSREMMVSGLPARRNVDKIIKQFRILNRCVYNFALFRNLYDKTKHNPMFKNRSV